jgi:hypothetical protein
VADCDIPDVQSLVYSHSSRAEWSKVELSTEIPAIRTDLCVKLQNEPVPGELSWSPNPKTLCCFKYSDYISSFRIILKANLPHFILYSSDVLR